MTDTTRDDVASRRVQPLGRMLLVQLSAYLIMVAVILAHWFAALPELFVVVVAAVVLLAYAFEGPCISTGRVGIAVGRIATAIFGMVSIALAAFSPVGPAITGRAVTHGLALLTGSVIERWSLTCVVLVVVLVVFGFIRQMARERREYLVRDLSYTVLNGVAAIAMGGWVAVARFWGVRESDLQIVVNRPASIVAVVFVVVLMIVLALASCRWWREYDMATSSRPWVGLGLLPMMIAGLLPVLASVVILV